MRISKFPESAGHTQFLGKRWNDIVRLQFTASRCKSFSLLFSATYSITIAFYRKQNLLHSWKISPIFSEHQNLTSFCADNSVNIYFKPWLSNIQPRNGPNLNDFVLYVSFYSSISLLRAGFSIGPSTYLFTSTNPEIAGQRKVCLS